MADENKSGKQLQTNWAQRWALAASLVGSVLALCSEGLLLGCLCLGLKVVEISAVQAEGVAVPVLGRAVQASLGDTQEMPLAENLMVDAPLTPFPAYEPLTYYPPPRADQPKHNRRTPLVKKMKSGWDDFFQPQNAQNPIFSNFCVPRRHKKCHFCRILPKKNSVWGVFGPFWGGRTLTNNSN